MKNLHQNFTYSLFALLIFFGTISCEMTAIEELNISEQLEDEDGVLFSNLKRGNLVYEETFEGSNPFTDNAFRQFAGSHSFNVSSSPVLEGKSSGRFELRKDDPVVTSSGIRAEVLFDRIENKEAWYSFGVYLPSNGYAIDSDNDVISQWHQNGSPTISVRVQNDKFYFRYFYSNQDWEMVELGPATKNSWHRFVFHVVHSPYSDGFLEIWKDGKKIFTRRAPTAIAGSLPRWKVGIYKASWDKRSTDTDLRVLFFDNIRIGNENATFEEMRPSSNSGPSTLSTSAIISSNNLMGHWKMDEGTGNTLIDHSGNKNNATIEDPRGVSWVKGRDGLALRMDKPSGRYFSTVPSNPTISITEAVTISGWIRPGVVANRMILSKGTTNGYELSTVENGKIEFRFNREFHGSTYRLRSKKNYPADGNTWMHVAATFDGTKSTIYINGVADNSATYSPTRIHANNTPLLIGARGTGYRWEGDLDDLRLYNKALSASEVASLANR